MHRQLFLTCRRAEPARPPPHISLIANGHSMPIRPFLADQAFEPEVITAMSVALERVCDALRLKMIDDIATRMVAEKIIKLAQRGVRDVPTLTSMALDQFKSDGVPR